jgi:hypothetical protein
MNGFWLKLIALLFMTIDHIGYILFPDLLWLRAIGRLAFPIFAFLVVEGFVHTSNFKKYFSTMIIFAFICQVPALFIANFPVNIFFTLSIGLFAMKVLNYERVNIIFRFVGVFFLIFLAEYINADYGAYGVVLILMFYFAKRYSLSTIQIVPLYTLVGLMSSFFQLISIFSLIPIYFYNGKRGFSNNFIKYGFYLYYPIHLIILQLILEISVRF